MSLRWNMLQVSNTILTKVPWEAEFLYYPHSICKNGRDLDWALGKMAMAEESKERKCREQKL